ncbi:uncharacterized protein LOC110843921 isoform X2 [Folsomia candida]|uniref:uncharacterized protein LOC110843921 isoform X2 n=1 Tax=Folsomia candida TaxID=158441 RepID=UPI000B8F1A8B|nr:uncharacterized protein LOC110843921 isoform X2 [Folsomia candida]
MDKRSSGFESWSDDDDFVPTKKPKQSGESSVSRSQQEAPPQRAYSGKYKWEPNIPNPNRDKKGDPMGRCLEQNRDGTICCHPVSRKRIQLHYALNHADEETIRKQKAYNLLQANKSRQQDTMGYKIKFFQLSRQGQGLPDTFPILSHGTEPTGEQARINAEISAINKRKYEESLQIDRSAYYGTVICQFKPPDDDPNMNMEDMWLRFEKDPTFESKWFYDVSYCEGPCPATHLGKNSRSEVAKCGVVEQYSTYVMRIRFEGGTKEENFKAAMGWQAPYCVLAQYKTINGVGGGTGMKITMLNKNQVQKSNHMTAVSPEEDEKLKHISIHGTNVFYPVQGYEDMKKHPWAKYTFPPRTTYFTPKPSQ